MLLQDTIVFIVACAILVRSAKMAVNHGVAISRSYRISDFVVSFVIAGFITTFPEFFVLVTSVVEDVPTLGLGAVLGNNFADLTLVLGLIVLAGGTLHVKTKKIAQDWFFLFLTVLPMVLALDGILSRVDGLVLLFFGAGYIAKLVQTSHALRKISDITLTGSTLRHAAWFVLSLALVVASSHFIVDSARGIAQWLSIPLIVVGMVIVAIGATLPELSFGLSAIRDKRDLLALGDVMGGIIFDATLNIGIVALIMPMSVPAEHMIILIIFQLTAIGLVLAAGRSLSRRTGLWLVLAYVLFIMTQFFMSHRYW